ncbi:hypothetical protein BC830DRAFT_1152405 [Chytriomyces sp. MP71]|nr:hypothetical protein BC830DRAFT_1152405 [Chytriomyces sp. MP71]
MNGLPLLQQQQHPQQPFLLSAGSTGALPEDILSLAFGRQQQAAQATQSQTLNLFQLQKVGNNAVTGSTMLQHAPVTPMTSPKGHRQQQQQQQQQLLQQLQIHSSPQAMPQMSGGSHHMRTNSIPFQPLPASMNPHLTMLNAAGYQSPMMMPQGLPQQVPRAQQPVQPVSHGELVQIKLTQMQMQAQVNQLLEQNRQMQALLSQVLVAIQVPESPKIPPTPAAGLGTPRTVPATPVAFGVPQTPSGQIGLEGERCPKRAREAEAEAEEELWRELSN